MEVVHVTVRAGDGQAPGEALAAAIRRLAAQADAAIRAAAARALEAARWPGAST